MHFLDLVNAGYFTKWVRLNRSGWCHRQPDIVAELWRPLSGTRIYGTIRREYLDRIFFWNALDLERTLQEFRGYYNGSRVHQSLSGNTPVEQAGKPRQACAALDRFGWREHCRGLFQTPVAV